MNISEIKLQARPVFGDMKDLVNVMRRDARVWSWGARGWANYHDTFLRFRVSGHHFKGLVWVGPNSMDLFDVYFTNLKGEIKKEMNNVYLDELMARIDEKVERIPSYKW